MKYLGLYKASAENHYIELKKAIKDLAQEDKTQNKALLKMFLNDYSDDLKAFFQATLDILEEIDTNEELFKTIMIENLNPMYYNTHTPKNRSKA
ncbi:hypothetical protein LS68_004965 [Helicobacter sp. MIT 05-5293]|uniref:hypothetical protein n=1 Tax=Helicobacter sp. MIT 05-5293 TaxID=1548149 RepID=UPI0010FECC88|nr:hypothetical protein [Helicobacter sp. MIT 05-5293]TLD80830.1 hypothetical protein LS68_004965 [Helicobacter sp. MIT 05-5293]